MKLLNRLSIKSNACYLPFHRSRLFAAIVSVAAVCAPEPLTAAPRPNIVFIMSDDHAAHAISAYGSRINQTPHLDRLAQQGMRLTHCFAVNSICTPSRACILTGKYSHINGVPVFNRFDGGQPHLARYLQAAGYHTGMIGKWHLFSDPTGFDHWNILPGQGVYHNPVLIENGTRKTHPGYVTDIITDLAMDFMRQRPKDKPFFLMCHHKAPHRPWQPDAKHAAMYEGKTIPEPATFNDDYQGRSAAAAEATMRIDGHLTRNDLKLKPPEGLRGPELARWNQGTEERLEVTEGGGKKVLTGEALKKWKYQKYIKDYLGCIASVDDNVGRLLDYLDREGLAENTLVIYTSDQGFFLGDHNWFDKRFMYEESIRMPFLARFPGRIKPGSVNDRLVVNVDFAPMLLEVAGLPVPPDMQGRSFLPLLRGDTVAGWREDFYYRYYHYPQDHRVQPHYGLRTEAHKLIYFNKLDQWELYDLKSDPGEMRNLYGQPGQEALTARLKVRLKEQKAAVNDQDQFADKLPLNE